MEKTAQTPILIKIFKGKTAQEVTDAYNKFVIEEINNIAPVVLDSTSNLRYNANVSLDWNYEEPENPVIINGNAQTVKVWTLTYYYQPSAEGILNLLS